MAASGGITTRNQFQLVEFTYLTQISPVLCTVCVCGMHLNLYSFIACVQFSCSVMSDSLRLHEPQHTRPPCPSPAPGVHSDSGPSSQWCHPAISSSVVPFSSCPQYSTYCIPFTGLGDFVTVESRFQSGRPPSSRRDDAAVTSVASHPDPSTTRTQSAQIIPPVSPF